MNDNVPDSKNETERAALAAIRGRFTVHTASWLREWYRQCAYGYAAKNVQNSLALGGEGLRDFRLEVDALIEQADQVAACFLHDEIWWDVDPYMDRSVVIYSVRLCMGRLRAPLERFGFIRVSEWREAQKIDVQRPVQRGDNVEWNNEIEFHPVATHRGFFRCDDKDRALPGLELSTDGWSALMLSTLEDYVAALQRIQATERAASEQEKKLAEQARARAVSEALKFAALKGNDDEVVVPKASLSDVLRAQRR